MGQRVVDKPTLERWRSLDAKAVLDGLGCHAKSDRTFQPVASHRTERCHVNVGGREFELLLRGPKFFDTRLQRGGGGAVDLVMHLHCIDFKGAVAALRRAGF